MVWMLETTWSAFTPSLSISFGRFPSGDTNAFLRGRLRIGCQARSEWLIGCINQAKPSQATRRRILGWFVSKSVQNKSVLFIWSQLFSQSVCLNTVQLLCLFFIRFVDYVFIYLKFTCRLNLSWHRSILIWTRSRPPLHRGVPETQRWRR